MTDLATLRPLVEIIAAERTHRRPELFEDAVQEGLIAAWQALEARPDAPTAYITGAARNGVRAVLRGRPMTGAATHRGREWTDAADFSQPFAADTDTDAGDDWKSYLEDPSAAEALEAVDDRLEAAGLWALVDALSDEDRRIVTYRFRDELTWAEVGHRVGKHELAARRRFLNHIVPALREGFGGLEVAA